MVVLLPKGNGNFMGIILMEVLWNTMLGVINHHIGAAVQFHDKLHGFRVVRGTGTASLEAKLLQQLMEMREDILYKVFF